MITLLEWLAEHLFYSHGRTILALLGKTVTEQDYNVCVWIGVLFVLTFMTGIWLFSPLSR